eukprot:1181037-Prorocentrum_minimum.AAC.5
MSSGCVEHGTPRELASVICGGARLAWHSSSGRRAWVRRGLLPAVPIHGGGPGRVAACTRGGP